MDLSPLNSHLRPLAKYLDDPSISEISINRECELFIERHGKYECFQEKALDSNHLERLAGLIANYNGKSLSVSEPRLAGVIPGGHRIQIICAPIVEDSKIALSIRKQVINDLSIDDLPMQYFKESKYVCHNNISNLELHKTKGDGKGLLIREIIKEAIRSRQNIIISGGTSSGKTTFMNACIKEIPPKDRLILLEDTKELKISHPNHIRMIAGANNSNNCEIEMKNNLIAALRLRPDRLLLGEIRSGEAATFLDAASTGHDGSIATIHANNPYVAIERLSLLCARGGHKQQTNVQLKEYIHSIIDMVIQLKKTPDNGRIISEILVMNNQ